MTSIELSYGTEGLALEMPENAEAVVLRKHALPALRDEPAAVRKAYAEPIGCAPLADLATGRKTACIVICDITRPVPNGLLLRPMVETLLAAGVERIVVLVATGLHRVGDAAEEAALIGDPWVAERVELHWHEADDAATHTNLGTLPSGTPASVDSRFVDADLRIVTGLVEPHFFAGWSGGRKVIAPGIAGADTIKTFHNHAFIAHPLTKALQIEGNLLHTDQLEIARRIGEVYAVNTVLDEDRHLVGITFGELVTSHLAAVEIAERICVVTTGRTYETIVTTSAGYPLDLTWYQAVKGLVVAKSVLAKGGTLIIAAKCAEGIGSPAYREGLQRLAALGPQGFLDSIDGKPLADHDEWQVQSLAQVLVDADVRLVTDMSPADRAASAVACDDDLTAAIRAAVDRTGDPVVCVIPEGPYVVPVV